MATFAGVFTNTIEKYTHTSDSKVIIFKYEDGSIIKKEKPTSKWYDIKFNKCNIYVQHDTIKFIISERSKNPTIETGGILVGHWDNIHQALYIARAFNAPPDSKGSSNYFERGEEGLDEILEPLNKNTQDWIGYIGEWHSHPDGCTGELSEADKKQMRELVDRGIAENRPGVMLIVWEKGIRVAIDDDSRELTNTGDELPK
jgi:hypothetical protein